jgi:hypothetical protein
MTRLKEVCHASLIVLATVSFAATASNAQDDERAFPETVMATFRVKPGQVDAFLKLMPEYWAVLRADDMVLAEPHLLLRGVEDGKPIVVEIFTWKTHEAPDHTRRLKFRRTGIDSTPWSKTGMGTAESNSRR